MPVNGEREVDPSRQDLVGMYLSQIGRTPLLDAAGEVEHAIRIEAGLMADFVLHPDKPEYANVDEDDKLRAKQLLGELATREELEWIANDGKAAKANFIQANLRLAASFATKHNKSSPMPVIDRIQDGNAGIIRAVEKFDYTQGYKFSTYGTWWVRQSINRGLAQQERIVQLPVHVMEELIQMSGIVRTMEKTLGRDPEPEEIASKMGVTADRVLDLMNWNRIHLSLNALVGEENDTELGDLLPQKTIAGPENDVQKSDSRERLNQLIDQLSPREAKLIRLRNGLIDGQYPTQAVLGQMLGGITAGRVRQIERDAMNKLRRLCKEQGLSLGDFIADE